jgi:hypothetical protein
MPLFIGYSTSWVSAGDGNRFARVKPMDKIMFANLFGGRSQISEISGISELKYGKNAIQKIDYCVHQTNWFTDHSFCARRRMDVWRQTRNATGGK